MYIFLVFLAFLDDSGCQFMHSTCLSSQ